MSNRRLTTKERTAVLRARPAVPPYTGTTSLTIVSVDGFCRRTETKVSLARVDLNDPNLIEDLDPNGNRGPKLWRKPEAGHNVTAAICGDPAPQRSALFERTGRWPA